MSIPTLVLTEIVLTLGGLGALNLVRRGALPASLFWVIGIGSITLTAFFGAIFFAGGEFAQSPYRLLNSIAGSTGVLAMLLGGVFSLIWRPVGTMALLITAFAVGLLIFVGIARVPTFGLGLGVVAMIGLAIVGVIGLGTRRRAAIWLLAGVGLAAIAELARLGGLQALPIAPADLYHLLLAMALISFGLSAKNS